MKKQRCSHTDKEDPDGICVRMGAVSLDNHWGTEENYSVSLGCVEEKELKKKKMLRYHDDSHLNKVCVVLYPLASLLVERGILRVLYVYYT